MDTSRHISYPLGHETPRSPSPAGEAPPASHRVVAIRQTASVGSRQAGCVAEFCGPVAAGVPQVRSAWSETAPDAWTPGTPVSRTEAATGPRPSEEPAENRLFHGPLDAEPGAPRNRGALWHPLLAPQCVEDIDPPGVELSKAGEASPRKGREGNRPLEALPLAPYKKKPKDLAPTWSSSTKAASLWSRT